MMNNYKPLLVFNGFGYTEFCISPLGGIKDLHGKTYPVVGCDEDGVVIAPWDWELIKEVSSDGLWIPSNERSKDVNPQVRTYIKVATKRSETYIDYESGDVFAIRKGGNKALTVLIIIVVLTLLSALIMTYKNGGFA